jgi:hypothetical protein
LTFEINLAINFNFFRLKYNFVSEDVPNGEPEYNPGTWQGSWLTIEPGEAKDAVRHVFLDLTECNTLFGYR